ncbi:hypothetical protein LMG8520_2208 [Lactococcus lactis subsp. lactis]|uniref:Photolyase/cryptochrome alpha/beta domain-containing protein n=2 Tax=Lactococcus lactis TaxID=1358 RepID=A0A2A5SL30_LACLH|nr:hypothetical protein LMG8520_2208 [Lactococcus lactis subsp. lactis]PCS14184.1 hypothetical protein RU90_GL000016 [Lactococcus lactis subsp. hordniae]
MQIHFGNPIDSLNTLIEAAPSITDIYFNTDETGYGANRDQQARNFLKKKI